MRELKHLKHYGLVLIFILAGLSVNAQHKTLELGFFGGTSYYIGDLNPALPYNMTTGKPTVVKCSAVLHHHRQTVSYYRVKQD